MIQFNLVYSVFLLSGCWFIRSPASQAQVVPDGSLSTTVNNVDRANVTIENGDRAGNNLFHSFSEFSVPDGGSATFNNAVEIENIFSRVTGGDISNINGAINANGGANLLLINPAGIVFGENASLNIGGSFLATTADSLLFESGEFSAIDPQAAPILTINRPIGLNFGENAGNIVNRSNFGLTTTSIDIGLIPEFTVRDSIGLQVNDGETISLIGGNVILENAAGITASGGIVELGGLTQAGKVTFNPDGSLVFPEGITRGNVILTEQARVNVTADGGGFINVNANNLELSEQSELFAGIAENSNSDSFAGDINIDATDSVKIIGELDVSTGESFEELIQAFTFSRDYGSGIRNNVALSSVRRNSDGDRSNGIGNGGNINISTKTLEMSNVAVIDTSVFGTGDGGDINIDADSITLTGSQSTFLAQVRGFNFDRVREQGIGDGGDLNINTGSITLSQGAAILLDVQSGAVGNGGDVNINASGAANFIHDNQPSFVLTQLAGDSVGKAGDIRVAANSISIDNTQFISDASNNATGDGGNITLNARENIYLDNESLILTQLQTGAKGEAGDINIIAKSLESYGGSLILADTKGMGGAGDINIDVEENIILSDRTILLTQVEENAVGDAGNIDVAAENLIVEGFSDITSQTNGQDNAGDISLNIEGTLLLDTGKILSQSLMGVDGNAGDIIVNADTVSLVNFGLITNSALLGSTGKAGEITLNVNDITIAEGSVINALSENSLDSGDVNLTATNLELNTGGKIVVTNDGGGNAGNINLNVAENIIFDNGNPPNDSIFDEPILQELKLETGLFASNTTSSGSGGSIFVSANSIEFRDRGSISASTFSGGGGNIDLQIADTLSLRNNSIISAEASGIGSGGNVNIDIDLLIAFSNGGNGNDIVANAAAEGAGGNINISTDAILGLQARNATPFNNTNDIDASSQFGLDGSVAINDPDVDPTSGIIELPSVPIDADAILAQDLCRVENEIAGESYFTVTGRGGLTPTSADSLSNINRVVNWTDEDDVEVSSDGVIAIEPPDELPNGSRSVIQSQGFAIAPDGSLWLTANSNNSMPQNSSQHPDCQS